VRCLVVVPCACLSPSASQIFCRSGGLDLTGGHSWAGLAGLTAGWLTWRRRRGHSATASLQLCARAVPCPSASCLSCGSSAASLSPVSLSSALCVLCRFVPSCPVEILTIALLPAVLLLFSLTPHHHHHYHHKPDPPSAYPSFPNAHVISRLSRSLARSPVVDQSPPAPTRPLRPVLVQRPAPSSASLDPLSSRLHARPRRCRLSSHQSSRGPGIALDSTQP
jgi:hypothetical protein